MNELQSHDMAGWAVWRKIGRHKLQVFWEIIPPVTQILRLLLNTFKEFRLRVLVHWIINMYQDLVQDFRQPTHLHETRSRVGLGWWVVCAIGEGHAMRCPDFNLGGVIHW